MDKKKHYYIEPVEIEVYLKKIGKIRTIIKDLAIELVPVEPSGEKSADIFSYFKGINEPIDLMEVQNNFPELIKPIYDSYYKNMELFEKQSLLFKDGLSGSTEAWRQSVYFTELLLKYEPTIASSRHIGDFQTYNLNYCIIKLNELSEKVLLEDATVNYLIKRRNKALANDPEDRQFNKLVELWRYNIKEKLI